MIKSEGKPLEVGFISICDAIHEKVCLCAPRGPTHGPAFACRDSCRVADCCIRETVRLSFTHAPPSMAQHAGYARMTPEIARAAIRLHGWPQRPPARELSLCPVLVGRCSAPVRGLLWTIEESTKKEQDLGRRKSSARDRYDTSPV